MDIAAWLAHASADADARGLPELKPLLETLARSTQALRDSAADHAEHAEHGSQTAADHADHGSQTAADHADNGSQTARGARGTRGR